MIKTLALGNWRLSDISVDFKGKYVPGKKLKKHIEKLWSEYSKKFPKAFNGPLGRLESWRANSNKLTLVLKLTNFSSYIGTRNPAFLKKFPHSYRADPLGITMVLETSDKKVIIGRRSTSADQNPGKLYFIGGYLNPNAQRKTNNILKKSILSEIKEELNLDKNFIKKITVNCLAYNPIYCHPEIFVKVELGLKSIEIKKRWKFAKDSKETDKIFFFKKGELIQKHKNKAFHYKTTWGFDIGLKYLIAK